MTSLTATEAVATYDDEDGESIERTISFRNRRLGLGGHEIVEINSCDGGPWQVSILGRDDDYTVEEAEAFAADLEQAIASARALNSPERYARHLRDELTLAGMGVEDLQNILDVTAGEALDLWSGRGELDTEQIDKIAQALDVYPFEFAQKLVSE